MERTRYEDDLLTVSDVTRDYRIGRDRVRKLVRDGELRHLRCGRRKLIPRYVVREWIRATVSTHPTPLLSR